MKCREYDSCCINLCTVILEEHTKNVNNGLNTKIYYYLETSGGQISNLYLNVVHFSKPVLIGHMWHLKTVVYLHWCLICTVLLVQQYCFLSPCRHIFTLIICEESFFLPQQSLLQNSTLFFCTQPCNQDYHWYLAIILYINTLPRLLTLNKSVLTGLKRVSFI